MNARTRVVRLDRSSASRRSGSRLRALVCLGLMGCSSAAEAVAPLDLSNPPKPPTVEPVARTFLRDPPPGKAGWFVVDGVQQADAAMLSDGSCVAGRDGRVWRIIPDDSVRTTFQRRGPCDGTAAKGLTVSALGPTVHGLDDRVVLESIGELLKADADGTARATLDVEGYPRHVATAGRSLLVVAVKDKKASFLRFEGETAHPVKIDGEVKSLFGAPNGQAFAVTTKDVVYHSKDEGRTWEPAPLPEKRLILGDLSFRTEGNSSKEGQLYLAVRRTGSPERLEVWLATLPNSRFSASFRTMPPDGVMSRDGVALTAEFKQREALNLPLEGPFDTPFRTGQRCFLSATFGASSTSACLGTTRTELVVRHTDDGGSSVRELLRQESKQPLASMAMSETEVLLGFGCHPDRSEAPPCEGKLMLLEREPNDRWVSMPIELPGQLEVLDVIHDRSTDGGFFVFTSPLVKEAAKPSDPTIFHLRDGRWSASVDVGSLNKRTADEVEPLRVSSKSVFPDGSLGLLLSLRAHPFRPESHVFLRMTSEGRLLEQRPLDTDTLKFVGDGQLSLVGRRIVALDPVQQALIVSEDAGVTFTTHAPRAFQQHRINGSGSYSNPTTLRCGSVGCDFENLDSASVLSWRWGDKPMVETLAGERSDVL
jgi:hypothetical protein